MLCIFRELGSFSVATVLGVDGELTRNAVLGLITHLHCLSKRVFVGLGYLIVQGHLTLGRFDPGIRPLHLFFSVS